MNDAGSQDKGIACRKCGCTHHYTTHTRRQLNGKVRRYRACRNCGHRFTTVEAQIADQRNPQ